MSDSEQNMQAALTTLQSRIGESSAPTDWFEITQERVNDYADVSMDHQWIHVDVERVRDEMPGGKTIAHGFLTLSIVPRLAATIWKIENRSRGVNYGLNKLRFTAPVPEGARVRLSQKLLNAEDVKNDGVQLTFEHKVEVEGQERPALIAEGLSIIYP